MKKIIVTAACSCIATAVLPQSPVITAENVYLIGDVSQIAWCIDAVEPGASGENVTWDFSHLTEDEAITFNYVNPSETLWGYQFPNATLCGVNDEDYHSYYRVADNHLIVEGFVGYSEEDPSDTLKVIYTDAEALIPLPFEYGDMHADSFEGVNQAAGFTVNFFGDIDLEVDGYGTLILPDATYTNAVRYHFSRTQTNTFLGQNTTTAKEQWGWMSPDHRFWLCLMETNFDGFSEQDIVWYAKKPLQLNTDEMQTQHIKVYPNPLDNGRLLHLDSAIEAPARVQLFSIDGSLTSQFDQYLHAGENVLNLGDKPAPGAYVLRVETAQRTLTSKLVIK